MTPPPPAGAAAAAAHPPEADVIDRAAGLPPGSRVHTARRFRATALAHTQASHDALLFEPVPGLPTTERLRVAQRVCDIAGAPELAAHYGAQLAAWPAHPAHGGDTAARPLSDHTAQAVHAWAQLLTTDPRRGDRAALQALREAGLPDSAIVALAQLVAFLSFQTRVVAGLRALAATQPLPPRASGIGTAPVPTSAPTPATPAGQAAPVIRRNGFTNETLNWRSWLQPVTLDQATPLQLAVLDESHPQARSSDYYLTLVHQPTMLQHRSAAYNAIMYAAGGLPRAERELGAMVVSVTNGCVYCTSVHAQRYAQLARRTDTVEQVFTSPATAGSTPRERAIARFAHAVTLRAPQLEPADLADLRGFGFSDEDVIDLLHAVAIFGWANRLMHNLGEPERVPG
ncbi:MAG: hypothetical protein RI988_4005 [Pseudomonadota bacterium]|jgi:uncharacterized peroxidase-related enzyme